MNYLSTVIAFGALSACSVSFATERTYLVLTWTEVFEGLMREIDREGSPIFFNSPESKIFLIDEKGQMILAAREAKYLERFLDAKEKEGFAFVAVDVSEGRKNYIFRRK